MTHNQTQATFNEGIAHLEAVERDIQNDGSIDSDANLLKDTAIWCYELFNLLCIELFKIDKLPDGLIDEIREIARTGGVHLLAINDKKAGAQYNDN